MLNRRYYEVNGRNCSYRGGVREDSLNYLNIGESNGSGYEEGDISISYKGEKEYKLPENFSS